MLKKVAFCLFSFALLLDSGKALFAQKASDFTVSSRTGVIVQLPAGTRLDLRNAAELTPEELRAALEKPSCGNAYEQKSANLCAACLGVDCTGTCILIPCGFHANADQQVPPMPGFLSFITGCTTTYVSTCDDLASGTTRCRLFSYSSAEFGNKTCINSRFLLQSVGCN
ncbi:MAG: hypothetical protein ABIS20_04690 [Thermoanaerobaculia bacterium]